MNTHTQPNTARTKRRFEQDGVFYVGRVGNEGKRPTRLLCFRCAKTGAVGASRRFSREEAWRKARRSLAAIIAGAEKEALA